MMAMTSARSVRYPPYTPLKTRLAKLLLQNPAVPDLSVIKYTIVFLLGLLSIYAIRMLAKVSGKLARNWDNELG